VVSTDSRVRFEALAGVFTALGFDAVGDQVFADLVIARVVEPTSLLDAGRVLRDLGRAPGSYATMKRTLRRVGVPSGAGTYRDQVAALCFEHARAGGDVSLVLYDVTTLYFEAEKEDDLRKVGFSKERRVDPQVVVGLLVDRGGFPLEIGCFEGNKAETATIIPVIKAFQARYQVADMVVVADAGMLSATNLRELDETHLRFIVGSRVTKAPIDLASHFRGHAEAFADGQLIDTITPKTGHASENSEALLAEPMWDRGRRTRTTDETHTPLEIRGSQLLLRVRRHQRRIQVNDQLVPRVRVVIGCVRPGQPRRLRPRHGPRRVDRRQRGRSVRSQRRHRARDRRVRGHQPEQARLATQHRDVRQTVPTQRQRHRQIQDHLGRVVNRQRLTPRRQSLRQPRAQTARRDRGRQQHPTGLTHHPRRGRVDPKTWTQPGTVIVR